MSDVIVFLETSGEKREQINRGLLTEGRRIASFLSGNLAAMTVGAWAEGPAGLEGYGVSTFYRVEGNGLEEYSGEAFGWAAKEALKGISFGLLLFAHTDRGAELAPRVAYSLASACVSGCVDINVNDNNTLVYEKFVYGGQFAQEVSFGRSFPEVATIRPEVLNDRQSGEALTASVLIITVDVPSDLPRSRVLDRMPPDYRTVDILYAKRIIGAGSGCADLFPLVEELSDLLESSIGTTRPVVDDGFIPRDRMIGQTGKTVSPELYLALGLSGSPHHVAGIQQSKTILSVNRDPKAPVFSVSDKGFAGDLRVVLPRLIARIKQYRDEGL
jgi:electron transfer flavoprotein alpha subunit